METALLKRFLFSAVIIISLLFTGCQELPPENFINLLVFYDLSDAAEGKQQQKAVSVLDKPEEYTSLVKKTAARDYSVSNLSIEAAVRDDGAFAAAQSNSFRFLVFRTNKLKGRSNEILAAAVIKPFFKDPARLQHKAYTFILCARRAEQLIKSSGRQKTVSPFEFALFKKTITMLDEQDGAYFFNCRKIEPRVKKVFVSREKLIKAVEVVRYTDIKQIS
ncbi:MAG TPA: hypothetical protein VKS21_03640, partial [Spirochaetota bacterium]|nr:hypothetical protein [Spirochaetota bacterium]